VKRGEVLVNEQSRASLQIQSQTNEPMKLSLFNEEGYTAHE